MNASQPSPDPWPDCELLQRQLLAALDVGVAVLDQDLRVQSWNPTLEYFSGLPADAVAGRDWFTVTTSQNAPALRQAMCQALAGVVSRISQTCLEFVEARAAGWFTLVANPLRGAAGNVAGIILVVRETPVAREEESLPREGALTPSAPDQASTFEMCQALLDASPDTILLLDNQGRTLAANQMAAHRLNRTKAEIVGHDIADFLPPEVARLRYARGEQVLATGQPVVFEDERNGRWLENCVCPVPAKDGRPRWLAAFSRDITERKQAELERDRLMRELRASEERYRTLAEAAQDEIFILDRQGVVQYVNRFAAQQFHSTPEKMTGHSLAELFPPALQTQFMASIGEVFTGGKPVYKESRVVFPIGETWLGTWLAPLRDAAGGIISVLGQSRDITERKQAEAQLLRRLEFERAIAAISARFTDGADLVEAIMASLGQIGRLTGAHRVLLFRCNGDDFRVMTNTHEWCAPGMPSHQQVFTILPVSQFPWWRARLQSGEAIQIADVAALGAEAQAERELLSSLGVRSALALPLHGKARIIGLVSLANVAQQEWGAEDLALLRVFTQILAAALERHEAEVALRDSERFNRAIINSINSGLVAYDRDLRHILWNPYMERITGLAAAQVLGKTGDGSFVSLSQEHPRELLQRALGGETAACGDTPFMVPSTGKGGWYTAIYSPLCSGSGEIIGVLASLADITARKLADQALRESEEKYKALIETTGTGYVILDLEGRVTDANPEYVRLTGHDTLEEILGHHVIEWTAPHDLERNAQEVRRCASSGVVRNLEIDYMDQAGRFTPLEISATVVRTATATSIVSLCRDISARRQFEAKLRQSEERFSKAFHLSPVGMSLSRFADGVLVDINESFAQLFGLRREAALGQSSLALNLYSEPADRQRLTDALLRQEPVHGWEMRLCHQNGTVLDTLVSAELIAVHGAPHVLGLVLNITERKRAESELREAMEFNRQIIASVQEGIVVVDRTLRIQVWNPLLETATGLPAQQVLDRPVVEFAPMIKGADLVRTAQQVLAGQSITSADYQYVLPSGKAGWAAHKLGPLRNAAGDIIGVIGTISEITARKATEEELRRSEERFRSAFDDAPLGVCMINLEGRLLRINHAMCHLFGYEAAEMAGMHFSRVTHPDDLPASRAHYQKVLAGVSRGFEMEKRYLHKSGRVIWAFLRVQLIRDPRDQPLYFLGHILDVTARKQAEEQLRLSGEQMRALAIRIETVREEERSQIAREIHDNLGQTLTGLKLDLAWIAGRLQAGQAELRARIGEMAGLIDEAMNTVRKVSSELRPGMLDDLGLAAAIEWQAQEFERRTGVPCACQCVSMGELDERPATALFRILQEALTNVIRHAQASRVTVRLYRQHGSAWLEIKDNGRGITQEELNRPGSLGLVSMRERALAFGGEIVIVGRPGRGTRVTARLPLGRKKPVQSRADSDILPKL